MCVFVCKSICVRVCLCWYVCVCVCVRMQVTRMNKCERIGWRNGERERERERNTHIQANKRNKDLEKRDGGGYRLEMRGGEGKGGALVIEWSVTQWARVENKK